MKGKYLIYGNALSAAFVLNNMKNYVGEMKTASPSVFNQALKTRDFRQRFFEELKKNQFVFAKLNTSLNYD
jgi:hypothetical protein